MKLFNYAAATYFNWEKDFARNGENYVYYFRANTISELNKWNKAGKNIKHPYAKLCMKGMTDF